MTDLSNKMIRSAMSLVDTVTDTTSKPQATKYTKADALAVMPESDWIDRALVNAARNTNIPKVYRQVVNNDPDSIRGELRDDRLIYLHTAKGELVAVYKTQVSNGGRIHLHRAGDPAKPEQAPTPKPEPKRVVQAKPIEPKPAPTLAERVSNAVALVEQHAVEAEAQTRATIERARELHERITRDVEAFNVLTMDVTKKKMTIQLSPTDDDAHASKPRKEVNA